VPPGRVPNALRQPFHPPRLRAGERCPTTAGTAFMNSYFGGVGLGTAPVRPDIGKGGDLTPGRIDLGSEPAPRPKRGGSRFSPVAVGAAPGDTINTGDGYRTDPRTTWISAPGCYAFQVDGLGFSELIVFQARAPAT